MNGLIGVESEPEKGSIFHFSIPMTKFVVLDHTSITNPKFKETLPQYMKI